MIFEFDRSWTVVIAIAASAPALLSAAGAHAANTEVEQLRAELAATKTQLSRTEDELESTRSVVDSLIARVEAIEAAPRTTEAAAPAPQPPATQTARIAPVNVDNPAISFVIDTELAQDTRSSWESIGYPNGTDFTLRSAELYISAPIDPFARGYVSVNASSDEGFNVEEAAIVTTALPWNLTLKGGRFFADVGRMPHWHDEAVPFVDRPPSIERLIGGESTSEGLEASWLVPVDHFIQLTGGFYNAVGAEYLEEINEDGFFGRRDFDELTFLARGHTYFDLTDTFNLELGTTWLGVPNRNDRNLWGLDVTLRHQPGTSGFYQGLVWGTEWYWNHQRFTERDDDGMISNRERTQRNGGYTYAEAFFGRRFSGGARFDLSQAPDGVADTAKTASAFVTWKPSEYQRLRFQVDNSWGAEATNQRFTLQWTAFIGSHSHGFAQR